MTLEEIKKDVEHCRAVFCETGDPCYHCAQKEWLIQELEKALNPPKMIVVKEPSPEVVKALFESSIVEVTNAWKMPIYTEPLTPELVSTTVTEEEKQNDREHGVTAGPEGDQQLAEPGGSETPGSTPIGSGG